MADEPRKPTIRPLRIIERPRLIRTLERSDARVRTLLAAAGYGKTTLLEQWAPREGNAVGWFRARRSARDVSVVARALVAASSSIVPGAGSRLLQRLAVTSDPERETTLLAEMLAEDLDAWPSDAWIAIDDYQLLAASTASERFVETIVRGAPVQLLLASEVRPSWVSPGDILAGDALELPQAVLAMTANEADDVLEGSVTSTGAGLVALARGWPAVVGLAGMCPDATDIVAELPETLFEAFADEMNRGLDPIVGSGLEILAKMPLIDRELAAAILGPDQADRVCNEALRLGILNERDGYLEIHPLVAAFWASRDGVVARPVAPGMFSDASKHYRNRGELDAAFDLTERIGAPEDVDRLVAESMDELLGDARLPTLELWAAHAADRVGKTPAVLLAQAEIALRQGRHLMAQTLSEQAVRDGDESVAYRANLIGGKAAHVGSREREALDLFRAAEDAGRSEEARRRARWGQLTAAVDLELSISTELLTALQASTRSNLDTADSVQGATTTLLYELRFGAVKNLAEAKRVAELLPTVTDPFLRSSFGSMFSYALNLAAEYSPALDVAAAMMGDATQFRVEFALPYGLLNEGWALVGLRRFDEAHETLSRASAHAIRCTDWFAQQSVYAGRIRAFLHEGRIAEACALEPPDLKESLPPMRGEVWASRGLALACIGRLAEARDCMAEVSGTTRGVEATVLSLCIEAVIALKSRDSALTGALQRLVTGANEAGAVDFVVTSYRASPDLLAALLREPTTAERTGYIVARASDQQHVKALGINVLAATDPVWTLSSREREVYDLVCEGLDNKEIGRRLFISPATVKVHVHHIYDKLGIRSRTALILHAASRRAYATPAAVRVDATSSATDG